MTNCQDYPPIPCNMGNWRDTCWQQALRKGIASHFNHLRRTSDPYLLLSRKHSHWYWPTFQSSNPQMSNSFQTFMTCIIFSCWQCPHDWSARGGSAASPREGGRVHGDTFPWAISSHLFWTVKWQLVVKSCRSIAFKCQTSTASAAHKEIFERPWREAKTTWLMFHLTSPPGCLAVPRQPCLCDVSLRAPAGSCSLTACTVCPVGSRTRETKRLKHKAAELRSAVARGQRGLPQAGPERGLPRAGPSAGTAQCASFTSGRPPRGSGLGKACQALPFLWKNPLALPSLQSPVLYMHQVICLLFRTPKHLPFSTEQFNLSAICIKSNYPEARPSSPALEFLFSLSYSCVLAQ